VAHQPARVGRNDRRFWPMPMALVLAGGFGGLIAVAVTVVIILTGYANYANTLALLNDKSVLMIGAVRGALRGQLDPTNRMINRFAELYRAGKFSLDDHDTIDAYLTGALLGNSSAEALIVYDASLRKRGVYSGNGAQIGEIETEIETNKTILDLIRSVKPNDPAKWGSLVFAEGELYANVSAPLTRNNKIDGYLVAAIGTRDLSRIMRDLAQRNNITLFLTTFDHRVLGYSGTPTQRQSAIVKAPKNVPHLSQLGDPVLAAFADREIFADGFGAAALEGVEVANIQADDNPHIVMTAQLAGYGPKPWLIGAYLPAHRVGSEFMRMVVSIAAAIGTLIVALLLAVWLGRRISRSLRDISQQSSYLAALDFEHARELSGSSVREINNAARAFNAMLAGLRAFTVYVPRSLVNKLISAGIDQAGRSHELELTVLFTDIEGFTALSENLPAAKTAELLNHHFEILVQCIDGEGGTVDKFMGDGVLAFWGAPDRMADHAAAACRAAAAIADAIEADNARALASGRPPIRMRIGVHTGPVIVGNIGAYDRVNYTIIGDTVNVCQRLQALGKEHSNGEAVSVLVSGHTRDQAHDQASDQAHGKTGGQLAFESVGKQQLRGRRGEVDIWRLRSPTIKNLAADKPAVNHSHSVA